MVYSEYRGRIFIWNIQHFRNDLFNMIWIASSFIFIVWEDVQMWKWSSIRLVQGYLLLENEELSRNSFSCTFSTEDSVPTRFNSETCL